MESNVKQTDALKDGVLVHVDSVPTGNKSGCICTKCGAELIAKNQGTVYAHHFAHAVDNKCAGETPYHIKAKEIIKRRKQIIVPWYYDFPITKYLDDGEVDNFSIAPNKIFTLDEYKNLSKYDKMLDFEKVVIEDTIPGSRYKSDLRALQNSNWINIEIVVTHSLKNPDSKDKMKFINDKKLDTLMITIKSDDIKDPDTKDFENYVLNTANREWVFNNDIPIILKQLEGMHKTFVDQYVSKYYDNAKAKSAEKENLWARIHKKSQDSKKMISDKEIFLETFKTLSIEEKLQVFVSHSREKMKLFIDKREDTNRLINLQLL